MQAPCLLMSSFQHADLDNGNIGPKLAITTPPDLGFSEFMYEANEYTYDNDDEISK